MTENPRWRGPVSSASSIRRNSAIQAISARCGQVIRFSDPRLVVPRFDVWRKTLQREHSRADALIGVGVLRHAKPKVDLAHVVLDGLSMPTPSGSCRSIVATLVALHGIWEAASHMVSIQVTNDGIMPAFESREGVGFRVLRARAAAFNGMVTTTIVNGLFVVETLLETSD